MASDLNAIRLKVRRLTRSPSGSQISDADIDEYVNTFVLYDFPEELRLFTLRQTFRFFTTPNVDVYTPANIDDIISVHEPVYIAGVEAFYSQNRSEFFRIYPFNNLIADTGLRGNGIATVFTGNVQGNPVLQQQVTITSIDSNNNAVTMVDNPLVSNDGVLYVPGTVPPVVADPFNTINYLTGAFTVTFTAPPAVNQPIFAETVPYAAGRPDSVLFFDNEFTVRPVPDRAYKVQLEVYTRPTALLLASQSPELEQWWQYISYGAAKKVFEDRNDIDSVQLIMPEFKKQERLVLRRTIVIQTNERVSTIYTDQTAGAFGPGFFRGGGLF
jgi:hypothetical protein